MRSMFDVGRHMVQAAVLLIAILWIASLTLPVWRTGDETHKGYEILGIGCLGLVSGQVQWLGNPLILLTCYVALRSSVNGWLLAALSVCLTAILVASALKRSLWMSTAGPPSVASTRIEQKYAGYYLWLAAVLLSAVLAAYLALMSIRSS